MFWNKELIAVFTQTDFTVDYEIVSGENLSEGNQKIRNPGMQDFQKINIRRYGNSDLLIRIIGCRSQ